MRSTLTSAVLGVVLGVSDSLCAQTLIIGRDNSLLQQGIQKWFTVSSSPSEYIRAGDFVITSPCGLAFGLLLCTDAIHRQDISSTGTVVDWGDGDWNIEGAPLPGSEDLLVN